MMEHFKKQQKGPRSPTTRVSKGTVGADSFMMAHVKAAPRAFQAGMGRNALEMRPSSAPLGFLDRLADAEAKDNKRLSTSLLADGGRDAAQKAAAEAEAEAEVAAAAAAAGV